MSHGVLFIPKILAKFRQNHPQQKRQIHVRYENLRSSTNIS